MNNIDIFILIVLLLGALRGFMKGFIMSVATLVGLIAGYYIALNFGWIIEGTLRESIGNKSTLIHVLAFVLCYILVIIIVFIIGKSVEKLIELAALGCVNRIAGAALGVLKGVIIISALIYVVELADKKANIIKDEKKDESVFYKPIASILPAIFPKVEADSKKPNKPK